MQDLDLHDWELQEIKSTPVTKDGLEEMYAKTKSYEALFSRKSTQIKVQGIDVKSLQEKDFKKLLLEHYSFLKRPVFITDDAIFVGNQKDNLEKLHEYLRK